MSDYRSKYREDPRISRRGSDSKSPTRDPRIRPPAVAPPIEWPIQNSIVQMPATHYTVGDGMTTYQHLVPQPAPVVAANMFPAATQYPAQAYPGYTGYPNYNPTGYPSYPTYPEYQPTPVVRTAEEYPQGSWAPTRTEAPPAAVTVSSGAKRTESADKNKLEGVAQEMKQQKTEMLKQREDYNRRVGILRRELELLKQQKDDRDSSSNLKQNAKLQIEIQNKLKEAYSVIEILTGIIGDKHTATTSSSSRRRDNKDPTDSNNGKKSSDAEEDSEGSSSSETSDGGGNQLSATKHNYVHYDPELHWCRICDVFPKTAKDLLTHLHDGDHRQLMQEENIEIPWHKLPPEAEFPYVKGASKKRVPIKGLQFFVSAPAWYCRLCDTWIGDLHCASQHLKSISHSQNYTNFVEQNPHWEMEWLKDREKALDRTKKVPTSITAIGGSTTVSAVATPPQSVDDGASVTASRSGEKSSKKKRKHGKHHRSGSASSRDVKSKKKRKGKKKKRHTSDSSSSSSTSDDSSDEDADGDKSKSIRVAMRNKMKFLNESLEGKWEFLGKLVEEKKRQRAEEAAAASTAKVTASIKDGSNKAMEEANNPTSQQPEDRLISQWMSVGGGNNGAAGNGGNSAQDNKDKYLLDSLKDRMKQKQDAERQRREQIALAEGKRERAREMEAKAREQEAVREAREREEEERERKDRERYKMRDQVKFRTYRKKRSASRSPPPRSRRNRDRDGGDRRRSRSSSGERNRNGSRDNRERDESPKATTTSSTSATTSATASSSAGKKLPFIGRMPLFKNKKPEEKTKQKEVTREDYEVPRQSRFLPGNLARSFIPQPDVVHFPKLSSYPPLADPPPPVLGRAHTGDPTSLTSGLVIGKPPTVTAVATTVKPILGPPDAPIISVPKAPPAPKIAPPPMVTMEDSNDIYNVNMNMYGAYNNYNMLYTDHSGYDYTQQDTEYELQSSVGPPPPPILSSPNSLPLQPPPLPPDDPNDDLAMLGISTDDLAAQMF